jgi:hypothetical protein
MLSRPWRTAPTFNAALPAEQFSSNGELRLKLFVPAQGATAKSAEGLK